MNGLQRSDDDRVGDAPSRTVRVAVIGGGVAGCSIAYHLGELGWGTDTLLLEKAEIAAGASAYAAGDLPQFSESPLVSRLCAESIALYHRLEKETGQSVGWHNTGGLRLAQTSEQMRDYARHIGRAEHLGIAMELVDRETTGELCPLLNLDGVLGAIWTPGDGHIDPASVIMAFAAAARARGVRIMRGTRVLALDRDPRKGAWTIRTDRGRIEAEIVVNAAGYGAVEVSAMAGHHLPMTLHEHQYILTEGIAELAALTRPVPQLRDMGAPFYARQEGKALLCSAYEARPVFRDPMSLPEESLAPDLDRSLDVLERCMARLPALRHAGIRTVVNAAVMRGPDSAPMLGPALGLDGFWVAAAFGAGFVVGSFGRPYAEWIVEGEPSLDLSSFDIRRFGTYATRPYTRSIVATRHSYSSDVAYPHAEVAAGRPLKTTPLTPLLKVRGAVFGSRQGWETPLWFAPANTTARDEPSFGHPNWFEAVGTEVARAREAALLELPCLARFEVKGPGSVDLLDALSAATLPEPGRAGLAPVLTSRGGVSALLRMARIGPDDWLITAWGEAEGRLEQALRALSRGFDADIRNVSDSFATLVVMGRHAEALLEAAVSEAGGPWREEAGVARAFVGPAPAVIMRTNEGGLPSWLLHVPLPHAVAAREALLRSSGAGDPADIGLRAWRTLGIMAGEPLVGIDFRRSLSLADAGLGHLGAPHKTPALRREAGDRLVLLSIAAGEALPSGLELVRAGKRPVGLTTSAMWSYEENSSLAFAEIDRNAAEGINLVVEVLGEVRPAEVRSVRFFA